MHVSPEGGYICKMYRTRHLDHLVEINKIHHGNSDDAAANLPTKLSLKVVKTKVCEDALESSEGGA